MVYSSPFTKARRGLVALEPVENVSEHRLTADVVGLIAALAQHCEAGGTPLSRPAWQSGERRGSDSRMCSYCQRSRGEESAWSSMLEKAEQRHVD